MPGKLERLPLHLHVVPVEAGDHGVRQLLRKHLLQLDAMQPCGYMDGSDNISVFSVTDVRVPVHVPTCMCVRVCAYVCMLCICCLSVYVCGCNVRVWYMVYRE